MNISPYLFFNGNCREAFEFYAECLGVEIKAMLTPGDTPMGEQSAEEYRDRIMHACIELGANQLMASDWNCGPNPIAWEAPRGFRVSLNLDTAAEAERVFAALAEDGSVDMPIEKAFFAERFGMLTDRFGTPWMILFDGDTQNQTSN